LAKLEAKTEWFHLFPDMVTVYACQAQHAPLRNWHKQTRQHALIFSPSQPVTPERHAMVSFVAACCVSLATAHTLLCTVNGDDSSVFRFLSLVTLTFDVRTWVRLLYSVPNQRY